MAAFTASVMMVEPVCRTREVSRNYGSVACTRFPTEVLGAGIYLWVNGFDQRCSRALGSDKVNDLFAAVWGHPERRDFDPAKQR